MYLATFSPDDVQQELKSEYIDSRKKTNSILISMKPFFVMILLYLNTLNYWT